MRAAAEQYQLPESITWSPASTRKRTSRSLLEVAAVRADYAFQRRAVDAPSRLNSSSLSQHPRQ
ncbi:MAG TPA: hypothetical protein VN804_01080, partial [Solirubrobacteraceae bacterium]|nr:hypothetical protein [Solirubrobacteraceae bacterium]